MKEDKNNIQQFEEYLSGMMDEGKSKAFEARLASDEKLRSAFESHKAFVDLTSKALKRHALKKRLNTIHKKSSVDKAYRFHKTGNRILRLTGNIIAAASVAAVVTFTILHIFGITSLSKKDVYSELKSEIEEVSKGQEALQKAFQDEKEPPQPVFYTGTCFAASTNGYLITNYHVIKDADSICVTNNYTEPVRYRTKIIFRDTKHDLVVLKIADNDFPGFSQLPYVISENEFSLGEYAFTLGYSKNDIVFGEGSISSTSGYNNDTAAYQISMPVNPGNSGGPLFNASGELIGIVSGKNIRKEGAAYALKSVYIKQLIDKIIDYNTNQNPPQLNTRNRLSKLPKTKQIEAIQPFIFRVQVYR
ncbi:MAG: serine protease [Bacteroidales bacterium]|nr:serine protease [Bacteroidales bacterium]